MLSTQRLTFINSVKTENDLDELWQNCFSGTENLAHMNAHVPIPLTQQFQLNGFLKNSGVNYKTWLIKRIAENDIIGFTVHGNFFPGLPNNIGFNIGLKYIKKGYATEALQSLIKYVKSTGLTETYGHCFETNTASIKTMEKCGFINIGPTGKKYNNVQELKFKIDLEPI
jgi:RimJ/RimL family protein N-acetyltransferase